MRLVVKDEFLLELCKSGGSRLAPSSPDVANGPAAAKVHCRLCDAFLCAGSSLKRQGSTIVCVGAQFELLVKPSKIAGGKKLSRLVR